MPTTTARWASACSTMSPLPPNSAGYDAHHADPLGGCRLEADSFHQMTCHVREAAAEVGAPVGAVLEGGYDPPALAESVLATLAALRGEGEAESIAPDPLITAR